LEAVEGVAALAAAAAVATLAAVGGVADAGLGVLALAAAAGAGDDHRRARVRAGARVRVGVRRRSAGATGRAGTANAACPARRAELSNTHAPGGGGQSRCADGSEDCLTGPHLFLAFLRLVVPRTAEPGLAVGVHGSRNDLSGQRSARRRSADGSCPLTLYGCA